MTKSGAASRAASNRPTASPQARLIARTAWSYSATASSVAPVTGCPCASLIMARSVDVAIERGCIAGRCNRAAIVTQSGEDRTMLPTPGFHHLHLNSVDPDAAIDWYVRQFPSCTKGEWAGYPGAAVAQQRDGAVHQGGHAAAVAAAERDLAFRLARHRRAQEPRRVQAAATRSSCCRSTPTDEGGSVLVSSDTWPNVGGVLGLTRAQIAEARAKGVQPTGRRRVRLHGGAGQALVEYAGNYPAERFNHVHLWQEEPLCALLWYQKHLNAPVRAGFAAAADRGGLQGATRRGSHLAGAEPRGHVPHPARRRRVRRRGADLVRQSGRHAAGQSARPVAGPHRAERRRSRRLGGEAARRRRGVAGASRIGSARRARS